MIDLRKLQHFVVLAQSENFTEAAGKLHISQPALSRSIQSLERSHDVVLFDRSRSGVFLTETGRQLLGQAYNLLHNATSLEYHLAQAAKGVTGEVRFGIGPGIAAVMLPEMFRQMIDSYPKVTIRGVVGSFDEMAHQLVDGDIEFFIGRHDIKGTGNPKIDAETIGHITIKCRVRPDHPLTALKSVPCEALADYPRLAGTAWNEDLSLSSADPIPQSLLSTVELDNYGILIATAWQTDAVLMYPFEDTVGGLVALPMERDQPGMRPTTIAYQTITGRSLSPAAAAAAGILRQIARETLEHTERNAARAAR